MGLMDRKAVVVAGGGRGIGRATAERLAAEGARVLVSDPGVTADGQDVESGGLADEVAAGIRAAGGEAVGTSLGVGSKQAGEDLVEACQDAFGGLDAVLAPAAILRDRMIFNMSEAELEDVMRVNLVGVYWLVKAATVVMRGQRSGRIVTFTSAAGLEGRGGTSNYAAAKMGVVGLTKAAAMDMTRYGVNVNCIAPRASTRLSQQVAADRPDFAIPIDTNRIGGPADFAPLATYLASERCAVTGRVFFSMGQNIGVYADFVPARVFRGTGTLDVETVAQAVEGYLTASVVEL
jgi:hypothetical protein